MAEQERTTLTDEEILTVGRGEVTPRGIADADQDDIDTDVDDVDPDVDTEDPS